jgi:hypothetical protein
VRRDRGAPARVQAPVGSVVRIVIKALDCTFAGGGFLGVAVIQKLEGRFG